jgi:hypothetical protein
MHFHYTLTKESADRPPFNKKINTSPHCLFGNDMLTSSPANNLTLEIILRHYKSILLINEHKSLVIKQFIF